METSAKPSVFSGRTKCVSGCGLVTRPAEKFTGVDDVKGEEGGERGGRRRKGRRRERGRRRKGRRRGKGR